jgi:UDP-N-acetyl-D-glucosamine dehydrogenase
MSLKDRIINGDATIGIVGLGYIGFSTAAHYANAGANVIGVDLDKIKVESFNKGTVYIDNIEYWLGFDYSPLVTKYNRARASLSYDSLRNSEVVFVAIPTERDGEPYMDILKSVVADLSEVVPDQCLVIVESTMTPGTTQTVVVEGFARHKREDVLVAVAPRRDWFVAGTGHTVKTIPRVTGSSTSEGAAAAKEVLSLVCDRVIVADSHWEAEMIKSVENAYRHLDITLANQLALANPGVNMRQVLELVGTKWNINSYYPNLGVGGYCIAPASKYVLGGVKHPEIVTVLQKSVDFTSNMSKIYADLFDRHQDVLVMGLAYKGGLKVDILSPGREICWELLKRDKNVSLDDPMYTSDEMLHIVGDNVKPVEFLSNLSDKSLILITADHMEYRLPYRELEERITPGSVVLDVYGVWQQHRERLTSEGVSYTVLGEKGWIAKVQ